MSTTVGILTPIGIGMGAITTTIMVTTVTTVTMAITGIMGIMGTTDTITNNRTSAGLQAREYGHYGLLLIMAVLSFISMYVLMYAMADRLADVYPNLNQFYMAGLMTAPMVVIEVVLMRAMYQSGKLNLAIIAVSLLVALLFFILIRQQTAIGDKQFLKSMIPHHGAAILMCGKAPIQDPEIKQLCTRIISNQQSEINQMNAILSRLEK